MFQKMFILHPQQGGGREKNKNKRQKIINMTCDVIKK